ncbi:Dentin sialophosphoprotein [Fasciola gigantica]|uniref:Dentin sialophosphoprotein n=1 Tax=Fasciola gigantica TaxID=46835 RepID=A0A504Z1D4_FASGI|nr:Dentin sialophosphoprotein [Fasciola gigantica]
MFRRQQFDKVNPRSVLPSRHTIFIRGLPGSTDVGKVKEYFSTETSSKCSIDFFSTSEDRKRLSVAIRFKSNDLAREMLNKFVHFPKLTGARYNNNMLFGHPVELTWFKDLKKARAKMFEEQRQGGGRSFQRPGYRGNFRNYQDRRGIPTSPGNYDGVRRARTGSSSSGGAAENSGFRGHMGKNRYSQSRSRSFSGSSSRSASVSGQSRSRSQSRGRPSVRRARLDPVAIAKSPSQRASSFDHPSASKGPARSNVDSTRRSGFENSKRITDVELNSFEDHHSGSAFDRRVDRQRSPSSAHWRSSEDSVGRDGANMESEGVYKASHRNRSKRELPADRPTPPEVPSVRSRIEASDAHSSKGEFKSRSHPSEEDDTRKESGGGRENPINPIDLIRQRKEALAQDYKRDCEAFTTVVRTLMSKDPELESRLMPMLKEILHERGQRCIEELRSFIAENQPENEAKSSEDGDNATN